MRPRAQIAAIAIVLLVVAVAMACGGGSDDTEVGSPDTETAVVTSDESAEAESETAVVEVSESATEPSEPVASADTEDYELAPELRGFASWINSEPLTLEELRGSVVLVDFWTYTCINCIRTLPFLKDWHEKYSDKGLTIIGVHTPEFEFEKIRDNVIEAADGYGLLYPIAQDNDYKTWRAFENRFWPAKYLIDKDGYIRYTHFGEGAYDETEEKIRELLAEAGAGVQGISVGSQAEPTRDPAALTGDVMTGLTRELYAGYERNVSAVFARTPPYIVQEEFYDSQDLDFLYEDPGDHQNHFMYLHGLWRSEVENLVHARETENYEDYVLIKFFATEVNAVMRPSDSNPFEVRLTLKDMPLTTEQAGADVRFDDDGNSFVLVDEPRMYNLVDTPEFGGHELKMSSNSTEFSLFAFTFGANIPGGGA